MELKKRNDIKFKKRNVYSKDARNLIIENLPISWKLFVITSTFLFVILPIISNYFAVPYFNIIYPIILSTYVLWLILYASYNYKKKTGKLLHEDFEKLRYKGMKN